MIIIISTELLKEYLIANYFDFDLFSIRIFSSYNDNDEGKIEIFIEINNVIDKNIKESISEFSFDTFKFCDLYNITDENNHYNIYCMIESKLNDYIEYIEDSYYLMSDFDIYN